MFGNKRHDCIAIGSLKREGLLLLLNAESVDMPYQACGVFAENGKKVAKLFREHFISRIASERVSAKQLFKYMFICLINTLLFSVIAMKSNEISL